MLVRCALSVSWVALITINAFAAEVRLGNAIVLSPEELKAYTTGGAPAAEATASGFSLGQVSGFSVDTADRTDVLSLYHCIYQASEDFMDRMGWVGDAGTCDAGTVSSAFHDDTLRRIHYYRAMTGLGTGITFDAAKNVKCQEAALIMSRNNGLSHHPIDEHPTWSCLTAAGDEAAGKSNISWGRGIENTGPRAVNGQIRDDGSNNILVGHRRWLLYPRAREMGNGGLPENGAYGSAASIWVIGDFGTRPPSPAWVSWPNPGYVPYSLVPARWSFSMAGANFNSAVVTMTRNGTPISTTKIHPTVTSPAANIGDPAIVWVPAGIPVVAPLTDDTYTVTISGITGGSANTATYSVILMDPYNLQQELAITGPEQAHVFMDNTYRFTAFPTADSYHLRMRTFADASWLEGAENSPPPQIIDYTDSSYPLRDTTEAQTGSYAFHLALPGFDDQVFEIDRGFVPSADSQLTFSYLRRWTDEYNEIVAQVSADDGSTWADVWVVNGVCPNGASCSSDHWDADWIPSSLSLAAYEGQPLRLRFALEANNWSYGGVGEHHGVFFDDIQVTDILEEVSTTETDLPGTATSFTLHPDGIYTYVMDMFVELGCHTFEYGPATTVSSVPGLRISRIEELAGQVTVGFDVTGGTYSVHSLERMTSPVGTWTEDTGAAYNAGLKEFTTTGAGPALYRVSGTP